MIKIIIIVSILILFVVLDGFFFSKKFITVDKRWKDYRIINYRLNNKSHRLLVADSEEKRTKGLMYIRKLAPLDGMIFVFSKKDYLTFWNKNTFLDLEVYWVDGEKSVGHSPLPSIEKTKQPVTLTSPKKVDTVIELVNRSK